jgi:hypothetical protein
MVAVATNTRNCFLLHVLSCIFADSIIRFTCEIICFSHALNFSLTHFVKSCLVDRKLLLYI